MRATCIGWLTPSSQVAYRTPSAFRADATVDGGKCDGDNATPAMYEADGRQFIAIAAGGGKSGAESGGKYVAFALP